MKWCPRIIVSFGQRESCHLATKAESLRPFVIGNSFNATHDGEINYMALVQEFCSPIRRLNILMFINTFAFYCSPFYILFCYHRSGVPPSAGAVIY